MVLAHILCDATIGQLRGFCTGSQPETRKTKQPSLLANFKKLDPYRKMSILYSSGKVPIQN